MAKQSALGSSLFVGSVDVSGDIGSVQQMETIRNSLVVTSIADSAESRIGGLRDGSLAYNAYWNTAAGQAHLTLSALATTDQISSVFIGATVGYPAFSLNGKQITYHPTRGEDGSLIAAINVLANGSPGEWGEMLTTGKQTFATGTVNGTSIDLGSVSTLFGAAAYLHVFSVASGTATFAIQDSANNTDFLDVTGMVFTGATGATSERKQGAVGATVRQYVRVQGTGVHGDAVIAVNFVRYTETTAS